MAEKDGNNMQEHYDCRVVKAIRSLRKVKSSSEEQSTRTHTPANNAYFIDLISNNFELKELLASFDLSSEQFFEIIKSDALILEGIANNAISDNTQKKILQKLEENRSKERIESAKAEISLKIQERMENLQKRLSRNCTQ